VKLAILYYSVLSTLFYYLLTSWQIYIADVGELKLFILLNDCWGYPICGLVLLMASSYKYGLLGFYAVLVDLGDAVADELSLPFDRISLEMIYRGLYHFSVAQERSR